jgi:glycosyltransferase involved in cell wall biosynthesis
VKFLGRLSRSDVDHLTREAIAHLVVLADTPHLRITMPSKIADLLHRGTPVVASVSGDPARLLEESGGAIVSAASDEVQLAAAIETVVRMDPTERLQLSKNARDYYAARLSQVVTVTGLVDELRKTAANA